MLMGARTGRRTVQRFVVTAHFSDHRQARVAIEELLAGDISSHAISMVHTDSMGGSAFKIVESSKAVHGTLGGLVIGAFIGALWFSLRYIGVLSEADLDKNVSILTGNWVAGFFGASLGGFIGGVIGYLGGRRIPIHLAEVQDEESDDELDEKKSKVLVAVTADRNLVEWVLGVLERHGGRETRQLDKKYQAEVSL